MIFGINIFLNANDSVDIVQILSQNTIRQINAPPHIVLTVCQHIRIAKNVRSEIRLIWRRLKNESKQTFDFNTL